MDRIRASAAHAAHAHAGNHQRRTLVIAPGIQEMCWVLMCIHAAARPAEVLGKDSMRAHNHSLPWLPCRALGDVFSQKIEGAKQVDLKRSLMTSVYGAAFIGEMLVITCLCMRFCFTSSAQWRPRMPRLISHCILSGRALDISLIEASLVVTEPLPMPSKHGHDC